MGKRFLVTNKRSGIGSDLVSVVGALDYAIATGRDLIIDWRESWYLADPKINLFTELFEISPVIESCTVHCAEPSFRYDTLPKPVLEGKSWPYSEFNRAMLGRIDQPEPTIVQTRATHYLPDASRQRELLRHIRPVRRIREAIERFSARQMKERNIVGIHIRHGNGAPLLGQRDELFAQDIMAPGSALMHKLRTWGDTADAILVCSDNRKIIEKIIERFNRAVVFDTMRGEEGDGHLHDARHGLRGAEDAVAEMWLLAGCQKLIYNPSWFSHYARIVGNFTEPPFNLDVMSRYATRATIYERLAHEAEQGGLRFDAIIPRAIFAVRRFLKMKLSR